MLAKSEAHYDSIGSSAFSAFRNLTTAFWASRRARGAWLLIALALLSIVLTSYFVDIMSGNNATFYDTLQTRNMAGFQAAAVQIIWVICAIALFNVMQMLAQQLCEIRWREFLTDRLIGGWMKGDVAYRIERDQLLDNPDQRLTDDIKQFANLMLDLGVGFLSTAGLLFVLGRVLWNNATVLSFTIAGWHLSIPGGLFWGAVTWGMLVNLITHLAGRKLAVVTFEQQKVDADYRFALAKARESAEEIALLNGADVERGRFAHLWGAIRTNWGFLVIQNIKLNFVMYMSMSAASLVPAFLLAPQMIAGKIGFGILMQSTAAFGSVAMNISWFSQSYSKLVVLFAVVKRLAALETAIEKEPEAGGIAVSRSMSGALSVRSLNLKRPSGASMFTLDSLDVTPGDRLMLRGPSGVGKSTFLRAIAGIWPYGTGAISLPAGRMMILPQKSYVPFGSLKEALVYPQAVEMVSDNECQAALTDCCLPDLVDRLHDIDRWGHRLSVGEQQRIAFARALLFKPDWLFLDEATSALDEKTEATLYMLITERAPHCTLISVAHRTTLDRFHHRTLTIDPAA